MKVQTKADLVLERKIITELAKAGMMDRGTLNALHIIYHNIKEKRGEYKPYGMDYKLDPKYAGSQDMWNDVSEEVKLMSKKPLGIELKKKYVGQKWV